VPPAPAAKNRLTSDDGGPLPERFDMFKTESVQTAITAAPPQPAKPAGERELLLQGTNDEWDRNPYTVRGDVPTARCPECGKPMHEGTTLCKHCGADLAEKERAQRTFEPVDCVWQSGWPLRKRLAVFGALQAINVLVAITSISSGWSASAIVPLALESAGLMAFLIGTFDSIHLTRSYKGKVALTHTWRYAFIAAPAKTIRWKEFEGVRVVASREVEFFEWIVAGILFLHAVIPGILFWWFIIRPDRFEVALCKDHGHPTTIICRTQDLPQAEQMRATISEVAGFPVLK
jgi:hypothetical protein